MNERSDALAVPIAVAMLRPTLLAVPAMPTLTPSLIVRRAQVEEAGALAALLGRAYPTETWHAAGTERRSTATAVRCRSVAGASRRKF